MSFSKTTEALGTKVNVPDARSQEDSQALNLLDQHTRKVGDRYETGLPWGKEETMFPNNWKQAYHRLKSHLEEEWEGLSAMKIWEWEREAAFDECEAGLMEKWMSLEEQ